MQPPLVPVVPFDLIKTRERFLPVLEQRLQRPQDTTICCRDDGSYCCRHPLNIYLPPKSIIAETNLAQIRKYATLSAYANTVCVDYEILQACHNIGLLFEFNDFIAWKELLLCGRIDDALWLEHATAEHTTSPHPSYSGTDITGIDYTIRRQEAKFLYQVSALQKFWERQNESDRAFDRLIDEERQLGELILYSGGRLDIRDEIRPGTPIPESIHNSSPCCSDYSSGSSSYSSATLTSNDDASLYFTASETSLNNSIYPTPTVSPIDGIAQLRLGPAPHSPVTFYQEQDPINDQLIITDEPIESLNHLLPPRFIEELDAANNLLLFREGPLTQEQVVWNETVYGQTGAIN